MYHRYERMGREAMMKMQRQAALLRLARLAHTPHVETGYRGGIFAALSRGRRAFIQAWRHELPRPARR